MKTFLSPLTPEQENECLKKLKKGSLEARNELTLHNMRLVAHVAKKYQNSEEDMEDLISIGRKITGAGWQLMQPGVSIMNF